MKCPYCDSEMEKGMMRQDRYALKWISDDPIFKRKKIKLTNWLNKTYVDAYLCSKCNKIIIDVEGID